MRKTLWLVPFFIWGIFTFWYTDLGGPLSEEEVDEGLKTLKAGDFDPQGLEQLEAFLRNDTGRQFLMVNNLDMNDSPPEMPNFAEGASAQDYLGHYMEHMYPQLFKRACHPTFMGVGLNITPDIVGMDPAVASGWDTAALMRYRSRRSFLEIITHPDMQGRHEYKVAALTKTIAYPVEPRVYLADPRFLLFLALGFLTAIIDLVLYRRTA